MNNFNISQNIRKLTIALIEQDKSAISTYCKNDYLKPEYVFQEIREYPGKLTLPPEEAFIDYEELPIDFNNTVVWFNLWFDGKKSDLIVEIRLTKSELDMIIINIQGLRVM